MGIMFSPKAPDSEIVAEAGAGQPQKLMLHCCCAPCASYALEYLSPRFQIVCLFYNPNIAPPQEYDKRAGELSRLLSLADYPNSVGLVTCEYDATVFEIAAQPYRDEPEGRGRCRVCFELRLRVAAAQARTGGFDCFTTTLSVSPHKDAALINEIGAALADEYGVSYLASDFKKGDGFKRSLELSKQYGLYRQTYCGCRM